MDATEPDSSSMPESPPARQQHREEAPLRLMCSVGGRILPRPHDNQLRYVGGDTRIVAVQPNSTYTTLHSKLSKLAQSTDVAIKYQLPNEDLDALISVTGDEDVENMMEEYDRLVNSAGAAGRTPRLRLFIFPADEDCPVGFGSILDGSGSKRDSWFLDVLNGTGSGRLQRGQSDASSLLSEVPDYLFGLDNNSKPNASETGSPGPASYSPKYSSTSSVTAPPADVQPAKPEVYLPSPGWRYMQEPVPVYYMPPPVGSGNMQVRPGPVQYFNPVQPAPMYRPPVQGVWSNPGHPGPVYLGGPQAPMAWGAPQSYEVAGSGGEPGGVVVMGRGSQN